LKRSTIIALVGLTAALSIVPFIGLHAANYPYRLAVGEGFLNPLGFYDASPTLSWQLPEGTKAQRAYRIVAASSAALLPDNADLWDSGKVDSGRSAWLPYDGKPLESRQRLHWQVKTWDEAGRASEWSEPAFFELGLLGNGDWKGRWIRMTQPETVNREFNLIAAKGKGKSEKFIPEYFRRPFELDGEIAKARLYVTAKGLYELYLNGQRIGEDYMAPGWTPYYKRIPTLTYDVTEQLRTGANLLGAVLGQGWYSSPIWNRRYSYPKDKPLLLLQLEITLADGSTKTIVTDASWKATKTGPLRFSQIYDGEVYDARMEMPGWNELGFDDSDWSGVTEKVLNPDVALAPKRHYPVRPILELKTVKVSEPQPGRYVFDLGQNMVGWPRLKIPVKNGKTVTIRVAEMLQQDGTLYTANYRSAKSTDFYTPATTGTVNWHPTFTFHGFRYVELSGLPEGVTPEPDWVTGVVLHSDFPAIGGFTSSHDKLNRLQSNIRWGQRGNFLDIPTDCPQRDERLGWTGDAQVFAPTSMFNFDVHAFWMSWLQSMREDQLPGGQIPNTIPNSMKGGMGSPGWADAAVTVPWNVYVRTGDKGVLEENYGMMTQWLGYYERLSRNGIVNRGGFGDWLQPNKKGEGRSGDTPGDLIATAYFGYDSALMQKTAEVLGRTEEAERYARQFAEVRRAFSNKFFDESGQLTVPVPTQTGYLLALGFDLLEPELREGAVRNLLALIEEADGHLRTGFLGTPLICPVLDEIGHPELAYQVLFKETYPSWFYSINQGATTMWERWNSYSHKDGFGDVGMNSFNHYAYGAVGEWMYERIAGLAPDPERPGYKHFFIQPVPGGPLTHARAELQTPYGRVVSGWKQTPEGLTIEAIVPPNTTATLVVPKAAGDTPTVTESGKPCNLQQRDGRWILDLEPGSYVFNYKGVSITSTL
jgi:alpha-L-rhamnosidase